MKKAILVTGGAGFIGSCLIDKLIENPDNFVVVIDNLSTGNIKRLPDKDKGNWKFIKCDCNDYRDISDVMTAYRFDYVFHYAAVVGVKRTLENPVSVLNRYTRHPLHFEFIKEHRCKACILFLFFRSIRRTLRTSPK